MSASYCKRYDERVTKTAFKALIATPATSTLTMPANGELAVSKHSGSVTAGTTVLSVVTSITRTIKTPALAADRIFHVGYFERGSHLTITVGFKLYLRTGLDKYALIGNG